MSWFDDQADIWRAPDDIRGRVVPDAPSNAPPSQDLGNGVTQTAAPGYTFDAAGNLVPVPKAAPTPLPATPPPTGGGDPNFKNGRTTDPTRIKQEIGLWAAMPGADPSLANDPDYWVRRILETGGLGADNSQYWQDAGVGPTAFFRNPNREAGSTPAPAPLSQIAQTYTPQASFTPPPAPTYTPYTPTAAPTPRTLPNPTPYTLPTAEEARQTPGYQFTKSEGETGKMRELAARSHLLGGGALKEIGQYDQGLADTFYGNRVNQGLAVNNSNFGQAFNTTQANNANDMGQWQANTNAGLSAAGLNMQGVNQQFQNTYLPLWNAYQSDVGQQQFGANYGLNANQQAFGQDLSNRQFGLQSQNQFWNQGFNENRNAYDQFDNSQKTAFDQWLKLANLGNPGNPYI